MQNIDTAKLFKESPPNFGHDILKLFAFDPNHINLNAGSYGATPLPVLAAVNKLTLEIEANPERFHRIGYQPLVLDVRRRLAQLIGADLDEVVLVTNASIGIATVLRNIEWENGDTLIVFNTTYNSISKTAQYIGDIPPHPTLKQFTLTLPMSHAEIITSFRKFIAENRSPQDKKTVVIIDTIVSNPGVLLPWKDLVAIAKDAGMWTLLDAAHSIGQETDINLSAIQPDFWVSNCHKWLSAKRTVAILYVPKRNQHIIKSSIPTSHSYISPAERKESDFITQYEWTGTIDFAPFISVATALDFRNWLGGEHKINAYCHDLALKGGKRLAEVLGTRVMDPDGELTLNMVNVEIPLLGKLEPTPELDRKFKKMMLQEYGTYTPLFYHNGRWWTRCSAQIWNELEDFEKLGKIWLSACHRYLEESEK